MTLYQHQENALNAVSELTHVAFYHDQGLG